MFISRFNRFFERHSRWLYLLLGIVISLSFVVFVTPGSMRDLAGGRSVRGAVGSMYGKSIPAKVFMRQLELADLAQYLRSGEFMRQDSGKGGALVQETLRRMRALREAENRGLSAVSGDELSEVLRKVFSRGEEGFDRELFKRFQNNVLYRNGYDGADLDEALRQTIIVERLDAEVSAAIMVSPNEAKDLYDQSNEEFVVSYALVRGDTEKEGVPGEAEVAAYFEAHRTDMRLPDSRRVRVVQFRTDDSMDKVTLTDKEIEDHFTRLKETAYKDKTLEQSKADIEAVLKRQKARVLAGEAAKGFLEGLKKAAAGMDAKAAAEQFTKACTEASLAAKDSGPFLQEGVVPEIGKYPNFQRAAYALTAAKPLPETPAYDAGTYFVSCWLETIQGAEPKELDEVVQQQVRDAILAAEGKAYYAASVEVHREALAGRSTAMDLMTWYEGQIEKESSLSSEEKDKRREAFRETIQADVTPYYVPLQKKVRAVVFRPLDFEKDVTVTDDQAKAYYEEHQAEYQKEEVRARQIVATLPPQATAEQKEQKRAVLTKALESVKAGTSFAEVAKEVSEDAATKANGGDMGFVSRGQKPPAVDEALFALEPGQVSAVLETPGGLTLLKAEEKRAGRSLADVQDEVRRKVTEEISLEKATEAAVALADAFLAELDKAQGAQAVPADLFSTVAKSHSLEPKDTSYFSEGGVVAPFGYDPEVSKAFFALSADSPCSGVVKGRKDVLVGCWLETKPGELPKLDDNPQLVERLKQKAKRDRATAAARKRATEAQTVLAAALKEGKDFATAAKGLEGIEFKTSEPFTRMRPASAVPDAQKLVEKLADTAAGTLLEPMDSAGGTLLVHLVSRTLPSAEKFAEERERYDNMARWSKRYAVVQEFYETLEKDSATVLNDPWKTMVANESRPRARR